MEKRKIFISYKYKDIQVSSVGVDIVPDLGYVTARSYVDRLSYLLAEQNHIIKAEKADEDISHLSEDRIKSILADSLYDSSITIVLISKGMMEEKSEKDQWIPWEVSYSLTEHTRDGRASRTNAMLAVVLPDALDDYSYFVSTSCNGTHWTWHIGKTFDIIRYNMFNIKKSLHSTCNNCNYKMFLGDKYSYILATKWDDFIENSNQYITMATDRKENIDLYDIKKNIE